MLGDSAQDANLVREIPKQTVKVFDLVNLVAGGDGFSGRRNRGIDAATPSNRLGRLATRPLSRR